VGHSAVSKKGLFQDVQPNRRRSSRVNFVTPVILAGRDATGQPYREETVTLVVNLHGAKIRTRHQVLAGMLVNVEIVRTGRAEKAVCVRVEEASPGETAHAIAIQLVKPGNVWGLESPPADWEAVGAELGGRLPAPRVTPSRDAAPLVPASAAPAPPGAIPAPVVREIVDLQLAALEQRGAQLRESALELLRVQAEVLVRNALQDFEERLKDLEGSAETQVVKRADQALADLESAMQAFRAEGVGEIVGEAVQGLQRSLDELVAAAEARAARRTDESFAELEAALATFRADVNDELQARTEQAIESAQQALRSKVAEMLSAIAKPSSGGSSGQPSAPSSKK
jgi:hypothetical protein